MEIEKSEMVKVFVNRNRKETDKKESRCLVEDKIK